MLITILLNIICLILASILLYAVSICRQNIPDGLVGLWCLTPPSTIFQLYRDVQSYWWMKPQVVVNLTTIRSRPWRSLILHMNDIKYKMYLQINLTANFFLN